MRKSRLMKALFIVLLFALAALYACSTATSTAKWHPAEVEKSPLCNKCHADERASLDHSYGWSERHRYSAVSAGGKCGVCHHQSFCSDCHARKDEIKPSLKYSGSPALELPHRGDYLTLHKTDGSIEPASCFRCHGRQENAKCRLCHR